MAAAGSDSPKKSAVGAAYNGYILSTLLYIIGEYATEDQIAAHMPILYEKATNPENKKLRDETKIELLQTVLKFFFKYCSNQSVEKSKDHQRRLVTILEWYASEMAENLEVYELLNFYYGLMKMWNQLDYSATVKIVNSGLIEELLPVHSQVSSKFFFENYN